MKKYGIYLLFPPTANLKKEGLGRYIAHLLKAAQSQQSVTFLIACPSWMPKILKELFSDFNIRDNAYEIISPQKSSFSINLYLHYKRGIKQIKSDLVIHNIAKNRNKLRFMLNNITNHLKKNSRKVKKMILNLIFNSNSSIISIFAFTIFSPLFVIYAVTAFCGRFCRKIKLAIIKSLRFKKLRDKLLSHFTSIRNDLVDYSREFCTRIMYEAYSIVAKSEATKIKNLLRKRHDICAWYCPAAFWPEFNELPEPRLLSVPDAVLNDFPIAFLADKITTYFNFIQLEKTIKNGQYFTTYSDYIKSHTLVQRYQINPNNIFTIRHGANCLNAFLGFEKDECPTETKMALYKELFHRALIKAYTSPFIKNYSEITFIFYASQFRPHKNILNLLKAYNYLLRKKYIGHKLILTGNLATYPFISNYIKENNLEYDVLCLYNMTTHELAACYKLAELAVNPSLSEGGFPFTFTEALSVGTPVVMARIPVTEEVMTDPTIQSHTLFDPYDWKDMADRIEFGLNNRELLLNVQRPLFDKLKERTWKNVADDYISLLDKIAAKYPLTPSLEENSAQKEVILA